MKQNIERKKENTKIKQNIRHTNKIYVLYGIYFLLHVAFNIKQITFGVYILQLNKATYAGCCIVSGVLANNIQ